MRIGIEEMKQAAVLLLDQVLAGGTTAVELDVDYYWDLEPTDRYDLSKIPEPSQLTVGQLVDDWQEIGKVLTGESDPLAYHLVWLSTILRHVGETVVR